MLDIYSDRDADNIRTTLGSNMVNVQVIIIVGQIIEPLSLIVGVQEVS